MWYTDDWDKGRRIRRALNKNERIALRLYDSFKDMLRSRRLGIVPQNVSIEWYEEKYCSFKKSIRSLQTYAVAKRSFKWLKRVAHVRALADITPEVLESAAVSWKDLGKSPGAIGTYLTALKTAMRKAEEWKYVPVQSWRAIEIYHPPPKLEYFEMDVLKKLLRLCHEPWFTAALLMGRCGLRSAEVRHLKWEDVLWTRRSVWIHQKPCGECVECRHRGGMWLVKGTKPGKPPKQRHVDMPIDVERHLQSRRTAQGFVLGEFVPQIRYWHWFLDTLAGRAGQKVTAHIFRHTYGAHLASNGVSLEKIGELMGHADPKTTKIYAHLTPSSLRHSVNQLPELGSGLVLPLASSKRLRRPQPT